MRVNIPADVKRRLRQEAGFGCCFCGHPFIDYHHIIPYAEKPHMEPEDMMIVCPNHHRLLTDGAVGVPEQRLAKDRPKNVVDGWLKGQLFITQSELIVNLGGGQAINTPNLLQLGEEVVMSVKKSNDGRVLISALVQDEIGRTVAELNDNEWSMSPNGIWDFEIAPKHAVIRSGPRKILFDIDCRNDEVNLKGQWHFGKIPIRFSQAECTIGTNRLIGMSARNCGGYISVGE